MSSRPPPEPVTLYLDRNLGGHIVPSALAAADIPYQRHDDHLPANAPDEAWIRLCAEKGWLGVTLDRNIRYRHAEIGAVVHHSASVLVIRAKNATGTLNAEILIRAYTRICRFVRKTPPPFVVGIDRAGNVTRYPLD